MTFGPWVLKVFKVLAAMKRLRGTFFDIFGYTSERKQERKAIHDFEAVVSYLLNNLTSDNYSLACEIAALPQLIRGFGHVKEKNYILAKQREQSLLDTFANQISQERLDYS